jgi:hypothetical protein
VPQPTKRRYLGFAALLLATALAGVFAASAVIGHPHAPDAAGERDLEPAAGTESSEGLKKDPSGGSPWTVRVYRGATGQTCFEVVQKQADGDLGFDRGKGFRKTRSGDPTGNCVDLAKGTVGYATSWRADELTPGDLSKARSFIFGVAASKIRSVTVDRPDAEPVTLGTTDRGAFLAVYPGDSSEELARATVTVNYEDGKRTSLYDAQGGGE